MAASDCRGQLEGLLLSTTHINLMADEPTRFTPVFMDRMLEHAERLNASDITVQTNEPIYAEVYGVLIKITNRRLSNTEIGDLINSIYGPNATTQLLSGKDIDTHYEFKKGLYLLLAPQAQENQPYLHLLFASSSRKKTLIVKC